MTAANVTAKRVSDNVVFQATGDTPFNFTGLGEGVEYDLTLPDGTVLRRTTLSAARLTRIRNTQLISVDTNLPVYTSAPFTANEGTDFILAVVTLANRNTAPTYCELELGGIAFTLAQDLIPPLGTQGNAMAIFYLSGDDIPAGANNVVASFFNASPAAARSVQVELIEFSGVDQTSPLYFGTATDNVYGATDDIVSDVTIAALGDHHVSVHTVRNTSGAAATPFTSDATILRNNETGIRVNESVATAITASEPVATGVSAHASRHGRAGLLTVLELAIGVRAA